MDSIGESASTSNSLDKFREITTYLNRDYQAYSLQHQINLAPVDDDEEARLRAQHSLLLKIFADRKNPLLPDFIDDPADVLDCGYGTGDWAYEVAETLPDCNVLGIDISPIMELSDMPDNLEQEIGDLNDRFTFEVSAFDFVRSSFVAGGIAQSRWPGYLTDIKRVLRSKGWAQFTEWDLVFRSDNAMTEDLQALRRWSDVYLQAISSNTGKGRKSRTVPEGLEAMLRTSGYSNVSSDIREIPTCGWPTSPRWRSIGEQNEENTSSMIKSIALYPVTSRGSLSEADFDNLTAQAVLELGNIPAKPYVRLYTVYGQKG